MCEDAIFEESGQLQWATGVGTHRGRRWSDDAGLIRATVAQDEAGDLAARLDFLRGAAHAANMRQVTKQGRVDPSHNDYPVAGRGRRLPGYSAVPHSPSGHRRDHLLLEHLNGLARRCVKSSHGRCRSSRFLDAHGGCRVRGRGQPEKGARQRRWRHGAAPPLARSAFCATAAGCSYEHALAPQGGGPPTGEPITV